MEIGSSKRRKGGYWRVVNLPLERPVSALEANSEEGEEKFGAVHGAVAILVELLHHRPQLPRGQLHAEHLAASAAPNRTKTQHAKDHHLVSTILSTSEPLFTLPLVA